MESLKKKLKLNFTRREFLLSQVVSMGFLHIGFGMGFPSPTLSQLISLRLLDDSTYPVFISLFVTGMALGNVLSIPGSKYLGRKMVAMASSLSVSAGLLLIAAATNPAFLLAGRLFHGIGAGLIGAITPVYLGELCPPGARGFLSGFQGVYDVTGALAVYVFGSFLPFRWLCIVGIVVSLLHTSLLPLVPLSPTWLYSRGLEKRARGILALLRDGDGREECRAIARALETDRDNKHYLRTALASYRLKATAVGVLLGIGFINTGTDIMLAYTSPLLEGTGGLDPDVLAVGVPLMGLIGAVLSLLLVERCGRKPLLLSSAVLVTASLLSLASYFIAAEQLVYAGGPQNGTCGLCGWGAVWVGGSLGAGRLGFQIGWGSVVYVIAGEIFPVRTRELAAGILQVALNTHAIAILTGFPFVAGAIGNGYTFLALGGVNIVSCVCIVAFLPETKGLRADEIEEIFQDSSLLCGVVATDTYAVGQ